MKPTQLVLALASAWALAPVATAQLSAGGAPPSSWSELAPDVPTLSLERPDVAALRAEDAGAPKNRPMRYGALQPVGATPDDSGAWSSTAEGLPVWRLRLESPGALSVSLIFDEFELPAGAELYVYDDERQLVLGAFTAQNNKTNRQFATQPVPGEALTLELMQPTWVGRPASLRIDTLVHDYVGILKSAAGGSGSCNIDVNCPVAANWQDEKRSVARTLSGGSLCSGALINNSASDGRQLFLTANHCGSMNNAVFLFNYERPGCGTGFAPSNQSVQGSVLQATGSSSDYRLVEITEPIPASYNVYYPGWNRSAQAPSSTVGIHHPGGDVKKICFDDNTTSKSGTNWWVKEWDLGVTEGGSSGSPLFNPQGQIIGQLCCGQAFCGFLFNDYYGRMDLSFSAMSSDLDPTGSGAISIDGFDPAGGGGGPACSVTQYGFGLGGVNTATLSSSSQPSLGSTMFLLVTNAPASLPGVVLMSGQQASTPLFGGTVLIDVANTPVSLVFQTTFVGTAGVNFTVPSDPVWTGLSAFAQAGILGTSFDWTLSNGLEIKFCN